MHLSKIFSAPKTENFNLVNSFQSVKKPKGICWDNFHQGFLFQSEPQSQ